MRRRSFFSAAAASVLGLWVGKEVHGAALLDVPVPCDRCNEAVRAKMREDAFYRSIMPPLPLTDKELDQSPAAISIPFTTLPTELYIRGPRYHVLLPPELPSKPATKVMRAEFFAYETVGYANTEPSRATDKSS